MMLALRLVFGILLVASALCFAAYVFTQNSLWRRRGITLAKWTLFAALLFFAVLGIGRLAHLM